MYKTTDRLLRFVVAIGMILLGTQSLFMCARSATPFDAVTDFFVVVWSFVLAYWWMFDSKVNKDGW